ncbi:MAG TPA: hypothetical protein VK651_07810, partial [Blastocatellia bacterium]|nr:hypothetical protein [Blastocatellia bacterium]
KRRGSTSLWCATPFTVTVIGFFMEATSLDLWTTTIGLLKTDPLKNQLAFYTTELALLQVELAARNLTLPKKRVMVDL